MRTDELFDGYTTYTSADELNLFEDEMAEAGYTPSSAPCIRLSAETVRQTIKWEC
ncbi:LxmA leader domain family RiPP [Nocardiopsis sp. CNT-189]|uniref:LxmA leader domain family RiPP n=1 Tax=Nocardiopsis oceanisediminis TaxID=2816862 RepID=UPI003B388C6C